MTKVLVTGGTGFIGSAVVRQLLAEKYEVRVLARHKKNRFLIENLDVEIAEGDIIYPESVEKAIRGCSIVFDLASIYTFYPFWEKKAKALYKINVQGITNVLNAALRNKVERFIHTSTIATIGRKHDGKPSDENTEFTLKNASHYARSKYMAEQEVLKFCKKGLPAIILNPAIVIGERDYKPTPSGEVIVKFLNKAYPFYFDTVWSVADVDDIARAHVAAIKYGRIGERYILCDKRHYTLKEIFRLLEIASGVKAPRLKIPYFLLLALTYAEEFVSYKIFKTKPMMPTEGVKFCKISAIYDSSKAVRELGYTTTPFIETLTKAANWYRKNAYIEPPGLLRFKTHGLRIAKVFMKAIKIHKYADKLDFGTLSFFSAVKLLQFLKWLGFKTKSDGWRKVTQSYLRTEHAKFTLAAFRLNIWSDTEDKTEKTVTLAEYHIIERLSLFFEDHPELHKEIKWGRFYAKASSKKTIDMVQAEFNKDGKLEAITPWLDMKNSTFNLGEDLTKIAIREIIKKYNETRNIPDKKRPLILRKKIYKGVQHNCSLGEESTIKITQFIDRVLSAAFIHFEKLNGSAYDLNNRRFQPPSLVKTKHPGFGLLNILCRLTPDLKEADLWLQFSHVSVDGVPMQEVLSDLKRKWGRVDIFKLPPPDNNGRCSDAELCSSQNHKNGIYHINEFIDFQPFLGLRRELNKHYGQQTKKTITVAALLMWRLAQTRAFENIKFAVPVDLRATSKRERTLGFVFIRPAVYFDKYRQDKGFSRFQQEFNRQLRATRKRTSESYGLLESYALLPACVYSASLKLMPSTIGEFVGTVGITIIKKADFFVGPSSDVHYDGFIAISNLLNPSQDSSRVCQVSIKGPKNKINDYATAIKEVAGCGVL